MVKCVMRVVTFFFSPMIFVSCFVFAALSEVRDRDPDAMVSGGHDPAPDPAQSE